MHWNCILVVTQVIVTYDTYVTYLLMYESATVTQVFDYFRWNQQQKTDTMRMRILNDVFKNVGAKS